jgi:hypothetical protein
MALDLSRTRVIENEWYWRINEGAQSLTVEAALRDFVLPLLKLLKQGEVRAVEGGFELVLGESVSTIALTSTATDKIALNHLVGDLNRALSLAQVAQAFALVVPRRYELRGALLDESELAALSGKPELLMRSSRPSWKQMPAQTTVE